MASALFTGGLTSAYSYKAKSLIHPIFKPDYSKLRRIGPGNADPVGNQALTRAAGIPDAGQLSKTNRSLHECYGALWLPIKIRSLDLEALSGLNRNFSAR